MEIGTSEPSYSSSKICITTSNLKKKCNIQYSAVFSKSKVLITPNNWKCNKKHFLYLWLWFQLWSTNSWASSVLNLQKDNWNQLKYMSLTSQAEYLKCSETASLIKFILIVPAISAISKHIFCALHCIKTWLQFTIGQSWLNWWRILHVYKNRTDDLQLTDVAEEIKGKDHCLELLQICSLKKCCFNECTLVHICPYFWKDQGVPPPALFLFISVTPNFGGGGGGAPVLCSCFTATSLKCNTI